MARFNLALVHSLRSKEGASGRTAWWSLHACSVNPIFRVLDAMNLNARVASGYITTAQHVFEALACDHIVFLPPY